MRVNKSGVYFSINFLIWKCTKTSNKNEERRIYVKTYGRQFRIRPTSEAQPQRRRPPSFPNHLVHSVKSVVQLITLIQSIQKFSDIICEQQLLIWVSNIQQYRGYKTFFTVLCGLMKSPQKNQHFHFQSYECKLYSSITQNHAEMSTISNIDRECFRPSGYEFKVGTSVKTDYLQKK